MLKRSVLLFVIFNSILNEANGHSISACSWNTDGTRLQRCLGAIRKDLLDKDKYWMGTKYKVDCPRGRATSIECVNPRPNNTDSLWSRTFFGSLEKFNASSIDRYLYVIYRSDTGKYEACGNRYRQFRSIFYIDATTVKTYTAFETRSLPKLRWQYNNGEYYTLLFFNIPNLVNLGVYINIQRNDISRAETIFPYRVGTNPFRRINPFLFILFKQQSKISLDNTTRTLFKSELAFRKVPLGGELEKLNLTGPIAVTRILLRRDPFSVQNCLDIQRINQCPALVTDAIRKQKRFFVPNDVELTVTVNVIYYRSHRYFKDGFGFVKRTKNVYLNPLGNGRVHFWDIQNKPSISLLRREQFPKVFNFSGISYTLMLARSDILVRNAENQIILLWMIVNIKRANVTNGDELITYNKPRPTSYNQQYFFLVYEQETDVNKDIMLSSQYCNPSINGRCRFGISKFVQDNKLKLAGASWMFVR